MYNPGKWDEVAIIFSQWTCVGCQWSLCPNFNTHNPSASWSYWVFGRDGSLPFTLGENWARVPTKAFRHVAHLLVLWSKCNNSCMIFAHNCLHTEVDLIRAAFCKPGSFKSSSSSTLPPPTHPTQPSNQRDGNHCKPCIDLSCQQGNQLEVESTTTFLRPDP